MTRTRSLILETSVRDSSMLSVSVIAVGGRADSAHSVNFSCSSSRVKGQSGPPRYLSSAFSGRVPPAIQFPFADAADFVEALRLDSRIDNGFYASHHPLDRRTAHEFISELAYPGFPADGNGRQHERRRELCLELALGDLVSQRV